MKLLLFGANGLLGRHLRVEFSAHGHKLAAMTRQEADITDAAQLDELFREPWDAVINAAAACDFDACENDPEGTGRVNRDAPLDLARRCRAVGAVFVQFSSDYVFGGADDRLLTEDDRTAPRSVYGRQKAALEREIPGIHPDALVLRISWLYGAGGKTFMSLLPGLLSTRDVLKVAAGKRGCCLYAADAAAWVRVLVERKHRGLINLVNPGRASWEEFARACAERMRATGWSPRCAHIEEVPYAGLGPHWGKRPRFSCLDVSRLARIVPPGPRPWTEALDDFLREQKSIAAPRTV
jgi:dTDP-4-dehydrorhamnose reductase